MIKQFLNKKIIYIPVISILVVFMVLVILPPEIIFFRKLSEFAVIIILLYAVLGVFFLITDNVRLVLVSLCCAAIIALFIKNFSNSELILPAKRGNIELSLTNINLIHFNGEIDSLISAVNKSGTDVLCFHEVTPGWAKLLTERLSSSYPYAAQLVRIDAFGKMVFLKMPYIQLDTLYYEQIPDLDIMLQKDGHDFHLICAQIVPPFGNFSGLKSGEHLQYLSDHIRSLGNPVLMPGVFNQVYWSKEMRQFVTNTHLDKSRKSLSMLQKNVPYDHIFYNRAFECTAIEEVYDSKNDQIGLKGTYQLKSSGLLNKITTFNQY